MLKVVQNCLPIIDKVIQDWLPVIAEDKTKVYTRNKQLLNRSNSRCMEYPTVTLEDIGNGYIIRLGNVREVFRDKFEGMQRYSYLLSKAS
jgi:hypothetical protein